MFSIIGIIVVFGAVIGGFLLEHGKLAVLIQPNELIIIGGAAIGTILVANPLPVITKTIKAMIGVLAGNPYNKAYYLESLKMLNDIFQFARKSGMAKLEEDVENPDKSATFSKYPKMLKDHHMLHFVCDTLRMSVSGVVAAHDLDAILENDIDVHHHEEAAPAKALSTVADALPGLGIVAAVLGVVITMGALGGPPEEIGKKVAAALVGTFLGILLCYGLVGPLAARMGKMAEEEHAFLMVLRVTMIAFLKGVAPIMAVEIGRRTVPGHVRPSFAVVEAACRGAKDAPAAETPAESSADTSSGTTAAGAAAG